MDHLLSCRFGRLGIDDRVDEPLRSDELGVAQTMKEHLVRLEPNLNRKDGL